MKSVAVFSFLVIVASLGVAFCSEKAESQDKPSAAGPEKMKKLQVERRDTLRQLLQAVTAQYQGGRITIDLVIRAQDELLDAELQLATEEAERIGIYKRRVANSRDLEEVVKQQHAAGTVGIAQLLAARAARLQADIELLQEQNGSD